MTFRYEKEAGPTGSRSAAGRALVRRSYDPYPQPGPVIGARYQVLVSRDGDQVLLHQRPTFAGRNAVDVDQRTEWAVHDITARARQKAARWELAAARHDTWRPCWRRCGV